MSGKLNHCQPEFDKTRTKYVQRLTVSRSLTRNLWRFAKRKMTVIEICLLTQGVTS